LERLTILLFTITGIHAPLQIIQCAIAWLWVAKLSLATPDLK